MMAEELSPPPIAAAARSQTALLFSLTLFLSAAAMFMVQPMMGKMLLPLVGGTPAGWIVAMAFFQLMLLAGYALAYVLVRFSPLVHALAYVGLLLAGSLFLPLQMPQEASGDIGAWYVFRLLASTVAIPFIALSATSSTLQRLFAAARHGESQDPYFLYAASNFGSFTGLLLYPLVIEPALTLPEQSRLWLSGYALLIAFAAICLLVPRRHSPLSRPAGEARERVSAISASYDSCAADAARHHQRCLQASLISNSPPQAGERVTGKRRLHWIMLAFFPSSLMLGVTSHITTDLLPAPMIWVLPLGIYLLTFVIAFSRRPLIPYEWVQKIHPTAVALAVALVLIVTGFMPVSFLAMGIHIFTFATVALLCHMQLAQLRPLDGERQLPDYYLMIALGGALGGVLNAFVAPLIFNTMAEYPLVLLLSCLMNPSLKSPFSFRYGFLFLLGSVLMAAYGFFWHKQIDLPVVTNALLLVVFSLVTFHPRATILVGGLLYLFLQFGVTDPDIRLLSRNFYGVMRVYDRDAYAEDHRKYRLRLFRHSTTTHSTQVLTPGFETVPTSYFSKEGPLGDVFKTFQPKRVAVMGLGAGTIACYATKDSEFTFFELDPAVRDMAENQFSYLSRCPGAKPHRILVGDARIEMSKLGDEKFDLIIFDAFSSDMVPVHLITLEAMQMYLSHLSAKGVMAFNLSSRYVRLEETVAVTAAAAGMWHRYWLDNRDNDPFLLPSNWIVTGRDDAQLKRLSGPWEMAMRQPGQRPWTDSYSSVAHVLRFKF